MGSSGKDSSVTPRSTEMLEVALFLSKYGEPQDGGGGALPPHELDTKSWKRAYAIFFESLGAGRTMVAFHNSLKNARDIFDAHLESTGRVGWRTTDPHRSPAPLTRKHQEVWDKWSDSSRQDLWQRIREYADLDVAHVPDQILADLEAEDFGQSDARAETEGGRKCYISRQPERKPGLRAKALRIHGCKCAVCHFDFGRIYGEWGRGYAEVHHLVGFCGEDEGERETDPERDLIVLCANCHRMVHRRKEVVLTVDELRGKLDVGELQRWASEQLDVG